MFRFSPTKITLVLALGLTLAACKSNEDRAEEYYQSSLALIESGDMDRALVELRNVFELQENHRAARTTLARIHMEAGNLSGAYSQYLRLVEQYPEDTEGRIVLSEIAFQVQNWDELDRHGAVAVELAADDLRAQTIALARAYREAIEEEDDPARQAITTQAETLIESLPGNFILMNVLLDSYVRDGQLGKARAQLDDMIAQDPEDVALYRRKLALLGRMEDLGAIEALLLDMIDRFPDDADSQTALVRLYLSQQELDKAEALLRRLSDPADEDPGRFISLVRFLQASKGEAAARAEIERAIEVNPRPDRFRAMLAMMDYAKGETDTAIATLEALLAEAEPSEETRNIKVMLARIFDATGNEVGARRLITEVLAEDEVQVAALKQLATWQIEDDITDEAIANLRVVLDQSAEDVEALLLMARAYTRAGSGDLARDFLALAVDASNNDAGPSLRYARLLISEESYLPAEDVLLPALRRAPRNIDILNLLGQLYLQMEDSGRATQVIRTLRQIDDNPAAQRAANALEARLINQRDGSDEVMKYLQELANAEDASLTNQLLLVRARLASGDIDAALEQAEALAAEQPDNPQIQFVLARTKSVAGDLEGAAAMMRAIVDGTPEATRVWLELARVNRRLGNATEADAVIDEGLAAVPDDANLLWAKAGILERDGDIDGALGIYDTLYEQNSQSIIIANNLASMLATYRDDDASLDRAWRIARRLSDINVPPVQDTYGWIAFRRGDPQTALPYLENAAEGLPRDPLVQYHLGRVYEALQQPDEALAQYRKAVSIAGELDTRPQIASARDRIAALAQ